MTAKELFEKEGFEPGFKSRYERNWTKHEKDYQYNVCFNLKEKTYRHEKLTLFDATELKITKALQKAIDAQMKELGW